MTVALLLNTVYFLLIFLAVVLVVYFFDIYSLNFSISIVSLVAPFLLVSGKYRNMNLTVFIGTVVSASFIAVFIQLFLPSLSNDLFIPFTEASYFYGGISTRATIFSREPSFAAEMIFPVFLLLLYFYKSIKFNQIWLGAIIVIAVSVRASTFIQQAYILISSYSFLIFINQRKKGNYLYDLFIYFIFIIIMFSFFILGYQLVIGLANNSNYINDSLDLYGSWRSISNISAVFASDIISFFASLDLGSWEYKITKGANSAYTGSQDISWIIQPFSLFAVYLLDFGMIGFSAIFSAIFFLIYKKAKFHQLSKLQNSILFALLTNTLFFSPKWHLVGFLIIGMIVNNTNQQIGD